MKRHKIILQFWCIHLVTVQLFRTTFYQINVDVINIAWSVLKLYAKKGIYCEFERKKKKRTRLVPIRYLQIDPRPNNGYGCDHGRSYLIDWIEIYSLMVLYKVPVIQRGLLFCHGQPDEKGKVFWHFSISYSSNWSWPKVVPVTLTRKRNVSLT